MTSYPPSLDDSYDDFPRVEEAFGHRLDESLHPRGPESLFEVARRVAPEGAGLVIDVGCGEGRDCIRFASDLPVEVLGVDPVARHVALGRLAAEAAGVDDRVRFEEGRAEGLPARYRSASLIWCREVLMFTDLAAAAAEFARVLRADGVGIAYQVFTGSRMSEDEAAAFWGAPGMTGARSVRVEDVEAALRHAGLVVRERLDYGSEWGEYGQERSGVAGRRLLHAARLLRKPESYVAEFGRANYEIMVSDCLWHVNRMIGKLQGAVIIFAHPAAT